MARQGRQPTPAMPKRARLRLDGPRANHTGYHNTRHAARNPPDPLLPKRARLHAKPCARDRIAHVCVAAPGCAPRTVCTNTCHQEHDKTRRTPRAHVAHVRLVVRLMAARTRTRSNYATPNAPDPCAPLFACAQSHQGTQHMPNHATRPTPPGTSTPGTPRPAPQTPGAHVRLFTWLLAVPNTTCATHDAHNCSPWHARISHHTPMHTVRYHGRRTGHIRTIPCTAGQLCRNPVLAVYTSSMAACIRGVMRTGFRHTVQVVHRSLLCEEIPTMRQ